MTAWMIWNDRNEVTHGGQTRLPAETIADAMSLLGAYTQAREGSESVRLDGQEGVGGNRGRGQHRGNVVWFPPEAGYLKVNVDGAMFKDVGVGMGVVIRDQEGRVIRAACQQVRQPWEVVVTEAKAIVLGLKLARQCNARLVVVESDNQQVINLVHGKKTDGAQLGMIVKEILSIISCFEHVKFTHNFREANVAAHTMAHLSPLDCSTRVWVGGCPSILEDVIASDFCLINNEN